MLLKLIYKKKEAENVYSFIFRPEKKIIWLAGQYLFCTLPNDNLDNRGVTRYFTISSAPFEKFIMLTTRISLPAGPLRRIEASRQVMPSSTFKKSLLNLKIGKKVEASGPDGNFTIDSDLIGVEDPAKKYIFIAGGIGITPFRSILLDLGHKKLPINVQLLYANSDENIAFKEELELLMGNNPNFKINYFISPNHIDEKTFSSFNSHFSSLNFYISGPGQFVRSIHDLLKEQGVPSGNIKLDRFPGYQNF